MTKLQIRHGSFFLDVGMLRDQNILPKFICYKYVTLFFCLKLSIQTYCLGLVATNLSAEGLRKQSKLMNK